MSSKFQMVSRRFQNDSMTGEHFRTGLEGLAHPNKGPSINVKIINVFIGLFREAYLAFLIAATACLRIARN